MVYIKNKKFIEKPNHTKFWEKSKHHQPSTKKHKRWITKQTFARPCRKTHFVFAKQSFTRPCCKVKLHQTLLGNKASTSMVNHTNFFLENKAQVAQKIVGRQVFMSRNTKNENLATSLPPRNSSIETLSLDFVEERSFTFHDGPNKRMKTLHLL